MEAISKLTNTVLGLLERIVRPSASAVQVISKVHLAVDSFDLPVSSKITGGQVHDASKAPALIESLPVPMVLIADKGYDSEEIR